MNVELLRRVEAHILEEPKRFIMDRWVRKRVPGLTQFFADGLPPRTFAECGTAACIAGWACILCDKEPDGDTGADLLGLQRPDGDNESGVLFQVEQWPLHYRRQWVGTRSLKKRAQIAVRRIERFIKTNGRVRDSPRE